MRCDPSAENLSARGAYELDAADGPAKVTLFATGTEVAIALAARELLEADGHRDPRGLDPLLGAVRRASPPPTRPRLIGDAPVRIAVEAGVRQGWERFIGEDGVFVGMTGFGASAPGRAALRALRHHRRGGGGGGEGPAGMSSIRAGGRLRHSASQV